MNLVSLGILLLLVLALGVAARIAWRRFPRPDHRPAVGGSAAPDPSPDALPSAQVPAPPSDLLLEPQASFARPAAVPPRRNPVQEDAAYEVGADFYAEVVTLLQDELRRAPRRDDLRLKLLEVYAATERTEDFLALARIHLQALADGRSNPAWAGVAEMGRRLAPDDPLFARDPGAPAEPLLPAAIGRARRYYEDVDAEALKRVSGELNKAWQTVRQDIRFWKKLREVAADFVGSPPRLTHAKKLSSFVGGAQILLRNEAQRPEPEGAVIAALGQVLFAQSLGMERVVASPADEGHALTVAGAARRLGLQAHVIVTKGEEPARLEELSRLRAAGAQVEVVPGRPGGNEGQRAALAQSLAQGRGVLFISPIAAGPVPYPVIVRELHGLVGLELKSQIQSAIHRLPDAILVSASDGMPAIGILQAFLGSPGVALYCVEASSGGGSRHHRLGREHHWLRASGRVHYSSVPAEVARFAAQYCMPDDSPAALQLGGGELLVETFTRARAFTPQQVMVVVLPAEKAAAPSA